MRKVLVPCVIFRPYHQWICLNVQLTSILSGLVTSHSSTVISGAPFRVYWESNPKSCSALDRLRTAAITRSPELASCRTNSRPIPLDAPTTTHVLVILIDCRGRIDMRVSTAGRTEKGNEITNMGELIFDSTCWSYPLSWWEDERIFYRKWKNGGVKLEGMNG